MELHLYQILAFLSITNVIATHTTKDGENSSIRCRTDIKSICPTDVISNWNSKNVGKELKKWIVHSQWNYIFRKRRNIYFGMLREFFTLIELQNQTRKIN